MTEPSPTAPISAHLDAWLQIRKEAKSLNTYEASRSAVKAFLEAVGDIPLPTLTEGHYSDFLRALKIYHARTEQLYATLIYGWFVYLSAKEIKPFNLARLQYARENEQRRPGKRLRQVDRAAIEQLQAQLYSLDVKEDLQLARAKSLVALAIESGLRVSELCELRLKDIDLVKLQGTVIGKGDKQRWFLFTNKSSKIIQEYLSMRRRLEPDRAKGIKPTDVPVFVSHSKRGHCHLDPIDTDTARADLGRMMDLLVGETRHPVTPHVLRHFAGNEFRKRFKDVEMVRILLGHESIETTKGYMHVEDEEALEAYRREFNATD